AEERPPSSRIPLSDTPDSGSDVGQTQSRPVRQAETRLRETAGMTMESARLRAAELLDAGRRAPDVSQFAGGVASDERHAAMRASVRRLGELLGEALTRHEGPQ